MSKLPQLLADARAEGWADMIRSEADEKAVLDGHYFDRWAGEHICEFIERFVCYSRGADAGKPFELLDWQRDDFLMPLFGWKRADGRRRYQKGDVWIAKKQGKSTLTAGIVDYMLAMGGPRTECYGLAHSRDQASIIYREAAAMVRGSPELAKRFKVRDSQKRILYPDKQSFYQVLAGENGARSVEGINPTLVVIDEIHVFRSRELYAAVNYASLACPDSLLLSVSTVGVEDRTTIWWENYEYGKAIIAGDITDHARFVLLFQADDACRDSGEMRRDPAQWRKAMPSLGHTVTEDKVLEQVIEAENSPVKEGELLRYVFNIPTSAVSRVVPIEDWKACRIEPDEWPDTTGWPCYAGLDIASTQDLSSLVLIWCDPASEDVYSREWAWCPELTVRTHERAGKAHYRAWVRNGWLEETEGARIDHAAILRKLLELHAEHGILELGFDQWNADAVVNEALLQGLPCVSVKQTLNGMSTGTTSMLNAISKRRLFHLGNPLTAWSHGNASSISKDDAIKLDKEKSADKIDPSVAMAMAFGRVVVGQGQGMEPQVW